MGVVEKITSYGIRIFDPKMVHIRRFNFKLVARLAGMMLTILACAMVLPIIVSLVYRDGAQFDLFFSAIAILVLGLVLRNIVGKDTDYELHEKESFWITSVIWILVPLAGSLPYLFTGAVSNFTDAAFESFSGFTTTGASVIADLDHTPVGLLIWRSLTQWIGGLGLILFIIAMLKKLNVGSVQLYDAEFSGTIQRKLHPRIASSVKLMWSIYLGLTAILFVLLLLGKNGLVDSFCLATSAVSTGGFMVHGTGLAEMNLWSRASLTFFMFLSGVNIALVYHLLSRKGKDVWKDQEFHVYLGIFLVAVAVSVSAFLAKGCSLGDALGFSLFHVASTVSTCGLSVDCPTQLPMSVAGVTFFLIIIGASAGSTGGGLKIKRLMILWRYVRNYFTRMMHPNVVFSVKVNDMTISDEYINKIFGFVFMYIMFIVCGAFVLTLCDVNIPTAVCAAAANIGNLGPSPLINTLGPTFDYVSLQPVAKWTLMSLMLVGRIEIFAILAVFSPVYWKR